MPINRCSRKIKEISLKLIRHIIYKLNVFNNLFLVENYNLSQKKTIIYFKQKPSNKKIFAIATLITHNL